MCSVGLPMGSKKALQLIEKRMEELQAGSAATKPGTTAEKPAKAVSKPSRAANPPVQAAKTAAKK